MFHKPGAATLDKIAPPDLDDEAAERRARHLRICRELAELALQLAQAAAVRAKTQLTGSDLEEAAPGPRRRRPDPELQFIRLSRAARQAVALEMRIAEAPRNPAPAAARARSAAPTIAGLAAAEPARKLLFEGDEDSPVPSLFAAICEELAANPDLALPTEKPAAAVVAHSPDPYAGPFQPNTLWRWHRTMGSPENTPENTLEHPPEPPPKRPP